MEDGNHFAYGSLTSWDEAEPSFLGFPQFYPKVRYTVTPGTFCTAKINNRSETVKILCNPVSAANITMGQAIHGEEVDASYYTKVNLFARFAPLLVEYAAKGIHLKPGNISPSVYARSMQEIVQTNFYMWIETSLITGFVFPFHQEDIDSGVSNVTGMELAFVLRYRLSLDCTCLERIESNLFKTFPSQYEDHNTAFRKSSDVSHKVFNALNCIRVELGRILCSSSLAEGDWNKKTHKFHTFPEEAWEFIKNYVEPQVEAVTVNQKRTIGMVRALLEIASYRRLTEVEVLYFQDDKALDRLGSLLGSAICFGLRGRTKPKAGSSYALQTGKTINAVTSIVEEDPPRQNPKGPSRFGIFLQFDVNNKQMTLTAYYEKVVIESNLYQCQETRTKRLRVFLDATRNVDADGQPRLPLDPSTVPLQEGDDFQDGNQLYIIKSHGNGNVVAMMTDDQGYTIPNRRAEVFCELHVRALILKQLEDV